MPLSMYQHLVQAMSLSGFENWRPAVDVPELDRPVIRPSELPGPGRIAAVMIMVYPGSTANGSVNSGLADSNLVLTKRNSNLSKHASQISFPGGQQDNNEALQQTALRETAEEIGIAPSEIDVLGQLNSVYIPPSDFTVTPFVGWHVNQPRFVRCETEVEEIIETSIAHLLKPSTLTFGLITRGDGADLNVPFYNVGPHRVWGATAIMLGEFIERLSNVTN